MFMYSVGFLHAKTNRVVLISLGLANYSPTNAATSVANHPTTESCDGATSPHPTPSSGFDTTVLSRAPLAPTR